jgi:hypothetical protein
MEVKRIRDSVVSAECKGTGPTGLGSFEAYG